MKYILTAFVFLGMFLFGCQNSSSAPSGESTAIPFVQNITIKDIVTISNSNPKVKFLDVRTPEETAGGMINGALEIDYRSKGFKEELDKLDKSGSYIVYCKSGGRSSKASETMQQLGFKSIYNLEGGYTAFEAFK